MRASGFPGREALLNENIFFVQELIFNPPLVKNNFSNKVSYPYKMNNYLNKSFPRLFILAAALLTAISTVAAEQPIAVKVVVVTMFEKGDLDDGKPGELELWVKGEKMDTVIPFPLGVRDLRMNDKGVLALETGQGATNASTTIMALGLDPRFDLTNAYWLIAGIAGADPEDASLGTAAWAEYVLDGDLIHEMDSREIPEDWPYGILPLSGTKPNEKKPHHMDASIVYHLNSDLTEWAYQLTKDHPIKDGPEMAAFRKEFKNYPNAMRPPFVMKGDSLGSSTYWHGHKLNNWANDWVKLYTNGKGNFVMTNMEDNGTVTSLKRLSKVGKVDFDRILVLRTASNYSTPPQGMGAEWHFSAPYVLGGLPALQAAYKVGRIVVHELVDNWDQYESHPPGEN